MTEVICPFCEEKIVFKAPPKPGQIITCGFCKEVLKVLSTSPINLISLEDEWDDVGNEARFHHHQGRKPKAQNSHQVSYEEEDEEKPDWRAAPKRNHTSKRKGRSTEDVFMGSDQI